MQSKIKLMAMIGLVVVMIMAAIFSSRQSTILAQEGQAIETERIQHCAVLLEPAVSEEVESVSLDLGCFDTIEAMESAVGSESMVTTVIARVWKGQNYTGTNTTWLVNNSNGCRGGAWFWINLPSYWNNTIESARSYSGCDELYLYNGYYRSLMSITCDQGDYTCRRLGDMQNKASSLSAHP